MSRQNSPDIHKLKHTSHCYEQAHLQEGLQEARERRATYEGSAKKVHASAASQMLSDIQEAASLGPTPGDHTHPVFSDLCQERHISRPCQGCPTVWCKQGGHCET